MDDKTLSLFEDIPTKRNRPTPRKPVPQIQKSRIPFDSLEGKKIVVTGRLFQMGRDEFSLWLKEKGAQLKSSVSNNADLLVVGENPGGVKLTRAKELCISICHESDFFGKFGSQLILRIGKLGDENESRENR